MSQLRLDRRFSILFISVFIIFLAASFYYYHKTVQDGDTISYSDFRVYYYAGFRLEMNQNIYKTDETYYIYKYSPIFALLMSIIKFTTHTPAQALCVWYFILFISFALSLYAFKESMFKSDGSVTLKFFYIVPFFFILRYLIIVNFTHYLPHYWPYIVRLYDKFLFILGIVYISSLFLTNKNAKENNYLIVIGIAILLSLRFILLNIDRGQINLVVLALLSYFVYYLINKKDITSGIYLGIAAILKLVPIIFFIYLLLKKRIVALVSSIITFLTLLFIPSIKWGFVHNIELIKDWVSVLGSTVPSEHLDHKNQSLLAMLSRFFSKDSDISIIGLEQRYLTILVVLIYILAVLFLIYVTKKENRTKDEHEQMLYDLSIFFTAMTFLSPIGTKTTFVYTILPIAVLVKRALTKMPKDARLISGLVIYGLLIYLNSSDIIGGYCTVLHKYSLMTISLLLLFGLLIYAKFGRGSRLRTGHFNLAITKL